MPVSSLPDHSGLASLLSEPLLPPSRSTTLRWEDFQTLQELRAAVQHSYALYYLEQFTSVISKTRGRNLPGFQRCCELSVSMDTC